MKLLSSAIVKVGYLPKIVSKESDSKRGNQGVTETLKISDSRDWSIAVRLDDS